MNPTTPIKAKSTKKVAPGAPIKKTLTKQKVNNTQLKHKKVLRDNINGISDGDLQRLAHKAGCKYVSALGYKELRAQLMNYLQIVSKRAITFTEHDRRRRVVENDYREALRLMGRPAMFEDGKQVLSQVTDKTLRTIKQHNQPPTTLCKKYRSKSRTKVQTGGDDGDSDDEDAEPDYEDSEDDNDEYEIEEISDELDDEQEGGGANKIKKTMPGTGGVIKPHRYKPGTVSLRRIRYYQKQPGHCFNIRKLPFRRLVKEVGQDYKNDLQYSIDAMTVCQLDAEQYMVKLCENALLCAIYGDRVRVGVKDIQLAQALSCHTFSL